MKKGIKKYVGGGGFVSALSGAGSGMVNPGNAALKQYTTTSPSSIPTGALPASGNISQLANSTKTAPKGGGFEGFMGNYGGAITQAAGTLMPLLMKKPDPNAKPYKKGTNMIKYQTGTKSLTKEEGKVGKGSEYFAQAKKLSAQERAQFRKLDAEAKERGMTFEFKGLKYDPTNPANLSSPSSSRSNVGITYSGSTRQPATQTTVSQSPSQNLVTDTTSQQPVARPARRPAGKTDAKTGYTIFPNNRVANPKNQLMGKIDTKGNIVWDNGQKETIAPATAAAAAPAKPLAKDTTGKPLIKKTQASKEGELTDEDKALTADLVSLGLDFGSILSPEPISAGGMAVGSQIAVNKARRLRGESAGIGTHVLETAGTALSAVPLVGDYAKANTALKTIGRILKSPATRKVLTGAGAAGVGLGGEQAINSMNEVYQKYEREGLTSLGKDDLRKAMEAASLIMNATQVGKGVSRRVRKNVTLPTAQELMTPERGIKFGITNKGNATKQVVGGAKVNKQGELEYDMTKQGRRPADMTQVEMDLRRSRREQAIERDKAAAPKRQEEFSKEFQKKTGYKTRAEMRQAEADKAVKAREQKRADYKVNKELQKERQEALQQDYERKLIKFSEDVKATKEAVKKSFKNKQAARKYQEQNTPQEAVVIRRMGDKTPAPIKMTPSQRLLPEGPRKPELKLLPESSELKAAREAAAKKAQRAEKRAAKKEATRIEQEKAAKLLAKKEKAAATRKANEEKRIQEKVRRIKFYGSGK